MPPKSKKPDNQPEPVGVGSSGKTKKPTKSRSAKAGLTWPVSRTHKKVVAARTGGVNRVSATAPVYIAAITEYFMAEVLELAGNLCKEHGNKRITPSDILHALRSDKEMNKATKGLSVLVGDRIRDSSDTIMLPADLKKKNEEKKKKEAAKKATEAAA